MKTFLKIVGVIVLGCCSFVALMEIVFPIGPNFGGLVVDSLYKSPAISKKLGKFKEFNVVIDSIAPNKDAYFYFVEIIGATKDTMLNASAKEVGDVWVLTSMSAWPGDSVVTGSDGNRRVLRKPWR